MIVQQKRCWNLNIYLRTLFYFIFNWSVYPPNFQYKKWTSARVRALTKTLQRLETDSDRTRIPTLASHTSHTMPQVPALQHWPTLFCFEEILPFPCMYSSNPTELSLMPDFQLHAPCQTYKSGLSMPRGHKLLTWLVCLVKEISW